jgi:hypothetical protein
MLVFIMVITAVGVTLYSMRNLYPSQKGRVVEIPEKATDELLKYHHLAIIDLSEVENILIEILEWIKETPNSIMCIQFVFTSPAEVNIVLYVPTKWAEKSSYQDQVVEIPDIWDGTTHHHYTVSRSSRIDRPVVALQWILKHSEDDLYHTDYINVHKRTDGEIIDADNKIEWENFRNKTLTEYSYLIHKNNIVANLYSS